MSARRPIADVSAHGNGLMPAAGWSGSEAIAMAAAPVPGAQGTMPARPTHSSCASASAMRGRRLVLFNFERSDADALVFVVGFDRPSDGFGELLA